jgi:hypothetical protein
MFCPEGARLGDHNVERPRTESYFGMKMKAVPSYADARGKHRLSCGTKGLQSSRALCGGFGLQPSGDVAAVVLRRMLHSDATFVVLSAGDRDSGTAGHEVTLVAPVASTGTAAVEKRSVSLLGDNPDPAFQLHGAAPNSGN